MNPDTRNIILIGFMGSGKTTIGKMLANSLAYECVDMDVWIEDAMDTTIAELFAKEGEAHFRNLETKTLKNLLKQERKVVSTGGGIVMREENRSLLDGEVCIYLDWPFDTLYGRIADDSKRPLATSYDTLHALFNLRKQYYSQCASYQIHCDGKEKSEILQEIILIWRGKYENSGY